MQKKTNKYSKLVYMKLEIGVLCLLNQEQWRYKILDLNSLILKEEEQGEGRQRLPRTRVRGQGKLVRGLREE